MKFAVSKQAPPVYMYTILAEDTVQRDRASETGYGKIKTWSMENFFDYENSKIVIGCGSSFVMRLQLRAEINLKTKNNESVIFIVR